MNIKLEKLGRRFNQDWIFRNISLELSSANSYAILGPNGSGKSTLLQLICGSLSVSEGTVVYKNSAGVVDDEDVYQYVAIAAPYLELVEEFTLSEIIDFNFSFKKYHQGLNKKNLIDLLGLKSSQNKAIKYFSSGMKQRTKLALAICSDAEVVLLDEPTSNLDQSGADWYLSLIEQFTQDRLVIVGSNQEHEYRFCTNRINILEYK